MLPFTWKAKNGNISKLPSLQASASTMAGKLYDSISKLTLDRFIRCACENDLQALFIDENDFVLTPEVIAVWEPIHEAFLDGMKDKEGLYKIRLMGKINHLEFNYQLIQLCIKFLSQAYDKEVVEIMQRIVRVGDFNPENMDSYRNDCQVVLNRAQMLLIQIEEKRAELAVIHKDETPGQKTTRKQFTQLITAVSIYTKFHINAKEIMVDEFIEYYQSRVESILALEAQYEKSKR